MSLVNKPEKDKSPLYKNQECASCKKLFECKGKPREVKFCLNYDERKKENEEEKS